MVRDKIAIHRFMRDKNISAITKSRINQYLNEFWFQEGRREFTTEQRVLDWLGPDLKEQVLFEAYSPFIKSVGIFQQFSNEFILELSLSVSELRLSKGEKIIRDKEQYIKNNQMKALQAQLVNEDPNNEIKIAKINTQQGTAWLDQDCLYFIINGSVQIHPNLITNKIILQKLKVGQIFGEFSFITGLPRQCSVTTSEYAHLQFISRRDFLDIIKNFPRDFEIFSMIRDRMILNQNLNPLLTDPNIQPVCYTCNQLGHMATRCPFTHYVPSYEAIDKVQIQDKDQLVVQRRKKIQRKLKKDRLKTLKNKQENQEAAEKAIQQLEKRMRRQEVLIQLQFFLIINIKIQKNIDNGKQ